MIEQSKTLAVLTSEAMALAQSLLETGGEITPEVDALLVANESALADKADAYDAVLTRLKMEEDLWRSRRDECLTMLRGYEALQDRIETRVRDAVVAMGKDGITGDRVRMKLQKAPPSLILGNDLPQDCYMTVTEIVPDKEKIKERLKAGETISGATLVQKLYLKRYVNRKE